MGKPVPDPPTARLLRRALHADPAYILKIEMLDRAVFEQSQFSFGSASANAERALDWPVLDVGFGKPVFPQPVPEED